MNSRNDKIGKWSLYGTLGGIAMIYAISMVVYIIQEGFRPLIPLIISLSAIALFLFILNLLPEKWVPFGVYIGMLFLLYCLGYSRNFMIFFAFFLVFNFVIRRITTSKRWEIVLDTIIIASLIIGMP